MLIEIEIDKLSCACVERSIPLKSAMNGVNLLSDDTYRRRISFGSIVASIKLKQQTRYHTDHLPSTSIIQHIIQP